MFNRATPPTAQHTPHLHLPTPQQHPLHPTHPLLSLKDTSQPIVNLIFITQKQTPKTLPPTPHPHFIAKLLTQGTTTKSKEQIAAHIDHYGADIHTQANKDTISLHLTTLAKHFHKIIPLITDLLQNPTFPQHALQQEKKIALQDLQLIHATPEQLAKKKLWTHAFGPNHPYSYFMTPENIQQITTQQLQQTFQTNTWLPGCTILTGHIDHNIINATQHALATLKQTSQPQKHYTTQTNTKPLHIQTQNPAQTSIAIGIPTITKQHPDYPALYVTNTLLGGYFGSRLMQTIREEKGYTYSITSTLNNRQQHTLLSINTEVKQGLANQTINAIKQEINTLRQQPIQQQELNRVKKFLSGTLLASFDNTFQLAKHLAYNFIQGITPNYYQQLYNTIQTITPQTIQKTAQKYLSYNQFAQVIINDSTT